MRIQTKSLVIIAGNRMGKDKKSVLRSPEHASMSTQTHAKPWYGQSYFFFKFLILQPMFLTWYQMRHILLAYT